MNGDDPYAAPTRPGGYAGADSHGDFGRITAPMLTSLRETRPWVRLVSIVGFVMAALVLVMGVFVTLAGGMGGLLGDAGMSGGVGIAVGLLYVVLGVLYVVPSLYLFRYARAIGRLLDGGRGPALEEALGHQRAFWRLVGILVLIVIGLYALILVGLLIAGLAGGLAALGG
ncbi:MAG TPA: DUF5362 family protein [Thermoanaerobaculia bacterium]|nr:DUF5362 family protein [Thermoanaerobaculia bacterium]